MNRHKIVKSNQEQAVASWINYLNQIRLDRFMEAIRSQDRNWEQAISTLNGTLKVVDKEIIEKNLGGMYGMHGFIAEVAECGVGNAREQIQGRMPIYEWINDGGPSDILRNGIPFQMKFSEANNSLSLRAIAQHFDKYPEYLKEGKKYMIPEDHYAQIKKLLSISEEQANKIPTSTGEFSLKQWRYVHDFFENGPIDYKDIKPSKLRYDQVQVNTIKNTISDEKISLKEVDQRIRNEAYTASKPSLQQGMHAAEVSAAFEGSVAFVSAVAKRRKEGKKIGEFESDDWKGIFAESGVGIVKGGVRGISIYELTNYTATPAAVASALCTASFGIAEQTFLLRKGQITKDQFLTNSELLCLDTSVSALSSLVGQVLIPIPVLGAVIGNTAGTLLYQIVKDNLSKKEQIIVKDYLKYLNKLDKDLSKKYREYIDSLNEGLKTYYRILERAFSPNYVEALDGSVALAMSFGIPCEELLKSVDEIDDYFLK